MTLTCVACEGGETASIHTLPVPPPTGCTQGLCVLLFVGPLLKDTGEHAGQPEEPGAVEVSLPTPEPVLWFQAGSLSLTPSRKLSLPSCLQRVSS